MARPLKDGLLYFSLDVDFFSDKKIKSLKARYGCDGIALYIYLLTEIYKNGYYCIWDEDSIDNVIDDLHLAEGLIKQIMEYLFSRSLLVKSILAESVTTLTSPGIQKRYQEAAKSLRRDIFVNPENWLLKKEETATFIKFTYNKDKYSKNPDKSCKNESKYSKNPTKEIKGNKKEIKEKEFCAETARESVPDKTETREQAEHDFQIMYDLYPKKRGRTEAFKRYLQWISPSGRLIAGKRCRLTNRQLYAAIKRYIDEQETAGKTDMQYWKNFDTLMGAQILDYVREGDSAKNELRS